jgi:hypothetical protein
LISAAHPTTITSEGFKNIRISCFTSLETLQFSIVTRWNRQTNPAPFLLWVAKEIEELLSVQSNNRTFSCLLCDFEIMGGTQDDLHRILSGTFGWLGLDRVLGKESIGVVIHTELGQLELFERQKNLIFSSCSAKGLFQLQVREYGPGGAYGIYSAIVKA